MATVVSPLANIPFVMQATGTDPPIQYSAYDLRLLIGAVFPRPGRIGLGDAVTLMPRSAGSNWSVDVMPGFAVIGASSTLYDRYLVHIPTRTNVSISTFNTAPTATRTHRVFLAVFDKNVSGTEYVAKIVITEDTGGGAPLPTAAPTLASYYLELGTLSISTTTTAITSSRITNGINRAAYGPSVFDLALAGGVQHASAANMGPPRYTVSGTTVKLMGGVDRDTGTPFENGTSLATLPAGYRPRSDRYLVGAGSADYSTNVNADLYVYRMSVFTNGVLQADFGAQYAPSWLSLDGLSFELD